MDIVLLLVVAALIVSVLNLIVLVGIAAFLVRFRDRINGIFGDLFNVMGEMPPVPTVADTTKPRPKTWDEKYEEELEALQRRLRSDSGLQDLPEPKLSWGEPPAPNPANTEGLTIKDR